MGWEDDRGVSEVLGAILLFGILVTAVGGYQAFVVPHQNEQVEHRHDMQVNDEFPAIQAAISNAAGSGEPRTASLTLGTDYPFRVFSVGMSPTTGNIRTGEPGTLSVDGDVPDGFSLAGTCGLDTDPETRSIQYRANYHEYDNAGRFVYENGVSYREVDGSVVVRNDQELVDGNTITLYPVTNGSFDRTSSASEQLRFRPGETGVRRVTFENEVTLSVPTELTEDHWERILDGEVDDASRISVSEGNLELTLAAGRYWFRCTPVGINEEPDHQGTVPSDDGPSTNEINPAGEGAVTFERAEMVGQNGINVTLKNRGDVDRSVAEIRIPFYSSDGQGSVGGSPGQKVNVTGGATPDGLVGGEYQPAPATIKANNTEDFTVTFFCEDNTEYKIGQGDFFAMNLLFDNGDVYVYFINAPMKQGSGNPGC